MELAWRSPADEVEASRISPGWPSGPEEIPVYVNNLSRILDFVRQLEGGRHAAGCNPLAHPLALNQRLRSDQITEHDW